MVLKQKIVRILRNQNKRKYQAFRRKHARIQQWITSTIEGKLVTSILHLSPIIRAKPQDVKQPKKNKNKKPKAKGVPAADLSQPSTSKQSKSVVAGAVEKESAKIDSSKATVKETQNELKNKESKQQKVVSTVNETKTSVPDVQPLLVDNKQKAPPESVKEERLQKHQKNNKNKKKNDTSETLLSSPEAATKLEQTNVEAVPHVIKETVKQALKKEAVEEGQTEKTLQNESEINEISIKHVEAVPMSVKAMKDSSAQNSKESTPKPIDFLKEANVEQLKTFGDNARKSKEPTPTPVELLVKEEKIDSSKIKRSETPKLKSATPTPTDLPKQENGSHQHLVEPEFKYQKLNKKDKRKKNKSQSQEPNSAEIGELEKLETKEPEVVVNQMEPPAKEIKVEPPMAELKVTSVSVEEVDESEWKHQKPNKKDRKKKNSGSDSRAETPKPLQSAKTEAISDALKVDVPAVKVGPESVPPTVREAPEKFHKANAGNVEHKLNIPDKDSDKQLEEHGKNSKKRSRKHKKSESDAYTQQPQKPEVAKSGRKKSVSESVHEQKKTLIKAEVEEFASDRSPTPVVPVNQPLAVDTEKVASVAHDNRQDTKCSVDSGVDVLCCSASSTNNLGTNGSAVGANTINNSDDNDSRRSAASFTTTTSDHLNVPKRGGKNKLKQAKHNNDVEKILIDVAKQRDTNFAKNVVELVDHVRNQFNERDPMSLMRNVKNGKRRIDEKSNSFRFSDEKPQQPQPVEEKIAEPQPVEYQQQMVTECVLVSQVACSRPPIILTSADFADLKLAVAQPPPTPIVREKRERVHRLLASDVEFCTYMMEKYGDDYEGMSNDERNIFMDNASAIARKIRIFRETPQYKEYLERKQQIVV